MADTYTVVKGDTLSEIALRFKSQYGYPNTVAGTYDYTEQLAKINNLTDPNYLVVGQVIKLAGAASSSAVNPTYKPTIKAFGLQSNTDRTVYVTWNWDKSYTENYNVVWEYDTGDSVWFIGSDTTVTAKQATYNAPSNAKRVRFKVKPISKTHKVNDKDTAYWTAAWSTGVLYSFSSNPPSTPPTPTVKLEDYTLTATLTNLDVNATHIEFQIARDDSYIFKTGTVAIITTAASYMCTVDAGSDYKVRCRSVRGDLKSAWSTYSNNLGTAPSVPFGIEGCYAASETSVFLGWSTVRNATSYDIEYTTDRKYFDGSDQTTVVTGIQYDWYEKTGLTAGSEYFFRLRAVNDNGHSPWTAVVSVIIGKDPAAPTTWSSTTTAVTGEEVILYWMHNAEDGSSQTYAELELYINGNRQTHTLRNSEDEDEKDKTSQFVINTAGYIEGSKIQWRVRTAGITLKYGDWSVQRTVDIYAPPTLMLSVTNVKGTYLDVLDSFPFYISALAGPRTQAPIGYHLTITANEAYETVDSVGNFKMVNKDEQVYSKHFDISERLLVEMTAGNIDLENNISYKITCVVTMNSGLTATSSVEFSVAWTDERYDPNAEIAIDTETYSASIRPHCEDENGDLIPGITLAVYRREFDGTFTELAKNIPNNGYTHITDPHPALDYARYRIVSTSLDTGAISYYDIPNYPVGGKAIIIQWNEAWSSFETVNEDELSVPSWSGSMLKLPYNIDVSDSYKRDIALVEYIGRRHPVSYYGTQVGESSTWSVDIDKNDEETLYALRRLALWPGDVYVREPSGSGYWANVNVSFSQTHVKVVIPVTITVTRVEGGV